MQKVQWRIISDDEDMLPSQKNTRSEEDKNLLIELIKQFDSNVKRRDLLVPLSESFSKIDSKLIGHTNLIIGPSASGKASCVYWALRNDEDVSILSINCELYHTQSQFFSKLARDLNSKLSLAIGKRQIIAENIKLADLNEHIIASKQRFVLLIRNSQKLVESKKQIILYNLVEWFRNDIKENVGMVFCTKVLSFVERCQKRVKSRLNISNVIVIGHPNQNAVVNLLVRRITYLAEQETSSPRSEPQLQKSKLPSQSQRFYNKIQKGIMNNEQLNKLLEDDQLLQSKSIENYLSSMQIALSRFKTVKKVLQMNDKQIKEELYNGFLETNSYIFPCCNSNLLANTTIPENIVMAIIRYMEIHQRTPYLFKTIYEIYVEMNVKFIKSAGVGSVFNYSKNVLERAVRRLEDLRILELEDDYESIWNAQIKSAMTHLEIEQCFRNMNSLPNFVICILES